MGLKGFFATMFGGEQRSRASIRSDGYLEQFFNMRGAGSASPDEVLSNMAVATASVSLRSRMLASVPVNLHRNVGASNAARAENHPLYDLFNSRPNDYQSAFEFREFLVRAHDTFGNAYARIERDARGGVASLHPFAPWNVAIDRLPSGRLRYRATDHAGKSWTLLEHEMLHVRGPSRDGVIGLSPIHIARGAMALAVARSNTAASLAANDLMPSGLYSVAGKLSDDQHTKLRSWLGGMLRSSSKDGRFLILDNGAQFQPLNFTPEDSQFLELFKLSNEDVARIFDCPPTSVGIVDRSTYSNTEQEALALVRNCLAPLAARFESAFARCLLTESGRREYFIRHDFAELLRGDMKTRFEAYRLAREVGVYSPNDVRRLENEAPIEGGDVYHMPANWIALGAGSANANGGPTP